MKAEVKDPIAKAPDIEGAHGKAWMCDTAEGCRLKGLAPEQDAALVHWLVEAAWAHPFWHSYSVVLIHLRDGAPDKRPPKIYKEGATHEVWVWAVDPEKDRRKLVETGLVEGIWLSPMNYGGQFVAECDAVAVAAVRKAVARICDGSLSPDTDFQWQWITLFGNDMVKREYQ